MPGEDKHDSSDTDLRISNTKQEIERFFSEKELSDNKFDPDRSAQNDPSNATAFFLKPDEFITRYNNVITGLESEVSKENKDDKSENAEYMAFLNQRIKHHEEQKKKVLEIKSYNDINTVPCMLHTYGSGIPNNTQLFAVQIKINDLQSAVTEANKDKETLKDLFVSSWVPRFIRRAIECSTQSKRDMSQKAAERERFVKELAQKNNDKTMSKKEKLLYNTAIKLFQIHPQVKLTEAGAEVKLTEAKAEVKFDEQAIDLKESYLSAALSLFNPHRKVTCSDHRIEFSGSSSANNFGDLQALLRLYSIKAPRLEHKEGRAQVESKPQYKTPQQLSPPQPRNAPGPAGGFDPGMLGMK